MIRKKRGEKKPSAICQRCARCCEYFCMEIDAPLDNAEYDDLAWMLAHQDVAIHIAGDDWQLIVHNRCRYADRKKGCLIYERRPRICREHVPGDCEYTAKHRHEYEDVTHVFQTIEELYAYRDEEARKKRSAAAKKAWRKRSRKQKSAR